MINEPVPAALQSALGRLQEVAAAIDTKLIRATELPEPEFGQIDHDGVARFAVSRDAPPEMRAVATAVAQGRTNWPEVLNGDAQDLPEVRELQAASFRKLDEELARQLEEQSTPEPRAISRPSGEDEEDDFSTHTYLRR
ncbi:hypothetical protein EV191_1011409 [Tamaricihabitans halophyticus]|uniref:Uncharacterized protein n=1 Tax=Tamaricihabitans halophyticus TaxID=1262583 RepID=A0A4R2R5Z3_9PSEU|nr:hypothetical protein [Tamaricihabitans halophyticus]TCP57454.1 hypothetical protein EV191_1011409 [Tamaricihabitans halophyticus]